MFRLAPLPYTEDALAPHLSVETLEIHYGKHHRGYVDKLNDAVEGSVDAQKSLEELVLTAGGDRFNFAAQIWNHDFFWGSLTPSGGGTPRGELGRALTGAFGSVERFKRAYAAAALGEFGSGWAWLVVNAHGALDVISSSDAENPLRSGFTPLLTIDVWEHAYYVDYRNERGRYVEAVIEHLLDYERADQRFLEWRDRKAA